MSLYVSESDILGPIDYFSYIDNLVSFERAMLADYSLRNMSISPLWSKSRTVYMSNIMALHFYEYSFGQFYSIILQRYDIFTSYLKFKNSWHGGTWPNLCRPVNLLLNTLYFDVLFWRHFTKRRHFVNWTKISDADTKIMRMLMSMNMAYLFRNVHLLLSTKNNLLFKLDHFASW